MIKRQFLVFLLRWAGSCVGMWICITLFAAPSETQHSFWLFIVAGLVFSLANSFIKPLLTMLSLPLMIVGLGLVVLLINLAIFALTIFVLPEVEMGFGGILLSTFVMWTMNTLVNFLVPSYNRR